MNLPTFVGAVSLAHPDVDEEQTAFTAKDLELPLHVLPNTAVEAVTAQDSLSKHSASTMVLELEERQSAW